MQAKWIRPIGRAREKDSRQGPVPVPAGMQLQNITPGPVKPCNNYEFASHLNAIKPFRDIRIDIDPRVRRSFTSLVGRRLSSSKFGSHDSNRPDFKTRFTHRFSFQECCSLRHSGYLVKQLMIRMLGRRAVNRNENHEFRWGTMKTALVHHKPCRQAEALRKVKEYSRIFLNQPRKQVRSRYPPTLKQRLHHHQKVA